MTVIIAENTPDRIRGILKRWFLEARPNVFIGNINIKVCMNVVYYLRRESQEWNAMVFVNTNSMQGYRIFQIGKTGYTPIRKSGFELIATQLSKEID